MKISDIADIINVTEKDPSNSGIDVFVGLEHYDIAEPVIKRFGSTKMLTTATKKFEAGDVLIARRNVYLQRASVARFSGLTSGDSIILRVKKNLCSEKTDYDTMCQLLPFILNSINFWDYANTNADGTMSKRLSPAILQEYEFDLPSIDEQKVLVEKLWAAYEVKQSYLRMIDATEEMVKSQFVEMFGDPMTNPLGIPMKKIKDVCKIIGGSQPPRSQFIYEYKEGYIRFIQIRDYKSNDYITYIPISSTKKFCEEDDIMIGRYGPPIFQILCGIKGAYNVALMKAVPIGINKEFLRFYLKRDELRHHLERFQSRTAGQAGIDMDELYNYPCPYPSAQEQEKWVNILAQANKSISELRKSIDAIDKVIKSLINENL